MAVSLEDLRVFRSVATAGSFGRGAARLRLSQPAVSERMARLERDLGRPLFLRGGRGVRLTAAGERLLPYAERCLALAEEAVAVVRAEPGRPRVRVALHATFAPSVVPRVLDALAPLDVEVACTDAHSEEVVRGLADHTVDIGFVVPGPYPHTLTVEPFLTDPVVCVARPGHPLDTGEPLRIRDLAAYPVACTTWGDGAARFLDLLRATPVPATRLHPVSPAETVASLARRGSHAGVLTRSTVGPDLAAGALVELPVTDLPRWELTLALAHRAQDAATAPVRALRAALLGAG
ncbi:LysR family transcriptional regulator [Streptomyces sp. NPDC004134]|uniref:LysR family transcriptional regulator n=1 Tax=Streptomyces sp. NPDC004134 TaxID=3364691 RepID=UPI003676D0FB